MTCHHATCSDFHFNSNGKRKKTAETRIINNSSQYPTEGNCKNRPLNLYLILGKLFETSPSHLSKKHRRSRVFQNKPNLHTFTRRKSIILTIQRLFLPSYRSIDTTTASKTRTLNFNFYTTKTNKKQSKTNSQTKIK